MSMTGPAAEHKDGLSLTESEVEFRAEDEFISIVPNFRMDPVDLISGTVGPFRPQIPVQVPLWMGLALKKRQKCSLQTPPWLTVESLSRVLEEERSSDAFQPLPYHYVEIAKLLFQSDQYGLDIQDAYQIRTLIQDIKDVRFHKIEAGLKRLTAATSAVKLRNLSAIEVTLVRPLFCSVLATLHKLDKAATAASEGAGDTPRQD